MYDGAVKITIADTLAGCSASGLCVGSLNYNGHGPYGARDKLTTGSDVTLSNVSFAVEREHCGLVPPSSGGA